MREIWNARYSLAFITASAYLSESVVKFSVGQRKFWYKMQSGRLRDWNIASISANVLKLWNTYISRQLAIEDQAHFPASVINSVLYLMESNV